MGMSLAETLKKQAKKAGTPLDTPSPMLRTGFRLLDYSNGYRSELNPDMFISGVVGGKIHQYIGRSSSGKTSFAQQVAANIIRPYLDYDSSVVLHYDFELSSNKNRARKMAKFGDKFDDKYIIVNNDLSTDSMFDMIHNVIDFKKSCGETIDTIDEEGNPLKSFVPTVFIVDSIPFMRPRSVVEKAEIDPKMTAQAVARFNSNMSKNLVTLLKKYNITIILINHIQDNISSGPVPEPSELKFLSQKEHLPGGKALKYVTDFMLYFKSGTSYKEDKEWKTRGMDTTIRIIKSRASAAGQMFKYVYFQDTGFQDALTNYEFIKKNSDMVGGGGASFYIKNDPTETKFSKGKLIEKYESIPEFAAYFDNVVDAVMEQQFMKYHT